MSAQAILPRALLLALLTFCAFLPVLRAQFIWDDDILITANPLVRNPASLPAIWLGAVNPDYLPLASSLFWLEARLWGLNPLGFHLVNLLLHALAAILLWRILLRLAIAPAWFIALIFALHPVTTATVAWVAEGKNTLSSLLAFASLLLYLRWRESSRPAEEVEGTRGGRRVGERFSRPYWAALALFLLALLSKASVVTFPFILLLSQAWRSTSAPPRLRPLLPFFALSALFATVALWFQNTRAIAGAAVPLGGPEARFIAAGKAVWFYAAKVLLPVHLAVIYPSWSSSGPLLLNAAPSLALLASFAAAWYWRRLPWFRAFLFGFGAYYILLLPVLGFLPMYFLLFAPVADHLQYLAMPALITLAVAALHAAIRRTPLASASPVILGLLALALGSASFLRASIYTDSATLWRNALRENPASFQAHAAFSLALAAQGRLPEAIAESQTAIRLNPSFLRSRLNLALLLDQARRLDDSIAAFRDCINRDPSVPGACIGLGNVLAEKGDFASAAPLYRQAIALDPSSLTAHQNLATALQNLGDSQAAIAEYSAAIDLDPLSPDSIPARLARARILLRAGRTAESIAQLQAAVALAPGDAQAHVALGSALLAAGSFPEAAAQLSRALEIDPSLGAVRQALQALRARGIAP